MRRVLVTGATGFIGRALCERLAACGYTVRAALRAPGDLPAGATERHIIGDIARVVDWAPVLADVDMVVHAAARTHLPTNRDADSYIAINVEGTRRLARAARAGGVRRFVLLSSIKVNGERTENGPFRADQPPQPEDVYGRSKLAAETALREEAESTMSWVILRPPLVFGPGVAANFLRLMRWIDRGLPLPFGAVCNRRSLVNLWNLTDLVQRTLEHPAAGNRVWLLADTEALSTPQLIGRIAQALGKRARLIAVPTGLLRLAGSLSGQTAALARLCGSLSVDFSPTCEQLQWRPPIGVDEALARTVAWYRSQR